MKMNFWTLAIVILMWAVSGFAGISFLHQAHRDDSIIVKRNWWRRYLHAVRMRFLYVMGILLIIWVAVSVFWVVANYRSFF